MTDHRQDTPDDAAEPGDTTTRLRSTVRFPYGDLDDAVQVAKAVYDKRGGSADLTQLSHDLDFSTTNSGAFRSRVSGATLFGFIKPHESRKLTVAITPLGQQVCDPATETHARARAFLEVPLYRKVFDAVYPSGGSFPADASGLNSMLVDLGVVSTQADRARQALVRSAEQAGFLEPNGHRLIKPTAFDSVVGGPVSGNEPEGGEDGGGEDDGNHNGGNGDQHSGEGDRRQHVGMKPALVLEMFKQLPDDGEELDPRDFETWLAGLKAVVPIAYKTKVRVRGELSPSDGNGT